MFSWLCGTPHHLHQRATCAAALPTAWKSYLCSYCTPKLLCEQHWWFLPECFGGHTMRPCEIFHTCPVGWLSQKYQTPVGLSLALAKARVEGVSRTKLTFPSQESVADMGKQRTQPRVYSSNDCSCSAINSCQVLERLSAQIYVLNNWGRSEQREEG